MAGFGKLKNMNGAEDYALERIKAWMPPELIQREMNALGCSPNHTTTAIAWARGAISRALDAEDIHALRESTMAAAADRMLSTAKRLDALELEIEDIDDRKERREAERSHMAYLNFAHRTQRDLLIAMVPKEVRQDTTEPEDDDIDGVTLKALKG